MAGRATAKLSGRMRRKVRVRKKVFGTQARPRLSVFRSAKHIYAQVIDDVRGVTLAAASTLDSALRTQATTGGKRARAVAVGEALAARCKEHNIEAVVFDRNGYRYHGRIRAVAEGARQGGLRL